MTRDDEGDGHCEHQAMAVHLCQSGLCPVSQSFPPCYTLRASSASEASQAQSIADAYEGVAIQVGAGMTYEYHPSIWSDWVSGVHTSYFLPLRSPLVCRLR